MKDSIIHNDLYYSICWLLAFFLFGILWYVLDRQYCTGIYRWWYNLTHKDALPDGVEKGLIYGQSAGRKFVWAFIASTVQSIGVVMVTSFHANPFIELVLWAVEIPIMVFGFVIGPLFFRMWQKRKAVFDTMDKIGERVERIETVRTNPTAPTSQPKSSYNTPVQPVAVAPAPVVEEDPRELIKKFTERS